MRRFIGHVETVVLAVSFLVAGRPSAAQLATSYEIGLPGVSPEEASLQLLLVGVRVSSTKPLVPGVDCEFIVLPVALAQGVLVFALGLDATFPLRISRSVLIAPRAGASVLAGAAFTTSGGFVAEPGYNVGGGIVWRTDAKTAVRVDIGRHWFDEYGVNVITIGVVTVP